MSMSPAAHRAQAEHYVSQAERVIAQSTANTHSEALATATALAQIAMVHAFLGGMNWTP